MELIVISPTRLKIMLTEPDMRRYALSADTAGCADGETRRSLRRLFDDARKETGFETEGGVCSSSCTPRAPAAVRYSSPSWAIRMPRPRR